MSDFKKILLLGATGRVGSQVLLHALAKKIEVVALVRNPDKITVRVPNLTLLKGSPENKADIDNAITGCDAVISALNNNRASDFPWSKIINPPFLMHDSIRNVIEAMTQKGIKRIVIITGTGAGDSYPYAHWLIRFLIKCSNIGVTFKDHDAQEDLLKKSSLDWTIVRPVTLTDAEEIKSLVISYNGDPKPKMFISRKLVAKVMLDAVLQGILIRKAPVISEQ